MPRPADLTAGQVADLKPRPSAYRVALNLYLDHPAPGRKSWMFRAVSPETGKPITMGLGVAAYVTVPDAKAKAGELRAALHHGRDPLAERRGKAMPTRSITFEACLDRYIAAHRASWRSREHEKIWVSSVRSYAAGLLQMPVARVEMADVMHALEPHWHTRTVTASRVRGRIETVLAYAGARGWRQGSNPAHWRGLLDQMLPSPKRLKPVVHHAALGWRAMPAFYAELTARTDVAALGVRLLCLTAVRLGEALLATWAEIDRGTAIWTIPAGHTKGGRAHRVPLGTEALALLEQLAAVRLGDVLLPGKISGRPLSPVGLRAVMRAMRPGMTIHGLRSGFRDWCGNHQVPHTEAEFCLAHVEGSETVHAYLRDDLLEPRRRVMERWGQFLAGG